MAMEKVQLDWHEIEAALATLKLAEGGFSVATRGVVTLPSGRRCFVKIGTNDETKKWANHEVQVYRWLERAGYPHKPRLLASTDGGFAIEDLSACDFSGNWTVQKLNLTLTAMDDLARLTPDEHVDMPVSDVMNGWLQLAEDVGARERLAAKGIRVSAGRATTFARQIRDVQKGADIVHHDIRDDNVAYDQTAGRVYVVDWNWCAHGSRALDTTAFLVSVQQGGLDVRATCPEHIDADAALFLAGFWFYKAVRPIWPGGKPALRDRQLQSARIALRWSGIRL